MEELMNQILDSNVSDAIAESCKKVLEHDRCYQEDQRDLEYLEMKYRGMELTEIQRIQMEDYIACILTADERKAQISYLTGIRDAFRLMNYISITEA